MSQVGKMQTGKPGLTHVGAAPALGCRFKPHSFVELHYTVPIQLADSMQPSPMKMGFDVLLSKIHV